MTRKFWLAALLPTFACTPATAPPSAPAAPAVPLAYRVPSPANVTYALKDSTSISVQGGALGNIQIRSAVTATTDVAFAAKGESVEATIRVTDLEGESTNSTTGVRTAATEAEISGTAVLNVTARGQATITSLPTMSAVLQRAGMRPSFFRWFFLPLPAGSVRPGAMWQDTIRTTDDETGTTVSVDVVVTSTFVRDTVIAGRTLAVITTSSQQNVNISGNSEGVQITQKLTGPGKGVALWDIERQLLVQRAESFQLTGTFDLPQMGISGLPITASSGVRLDLQ